MRKLIALFAVTVVAASAFAQGTVNFNNRLTFATTGDRLVYADQAGTIPLVGTDWVAQLYYGSQGTVEGSLVAVGASPATFRVATTTSPGTWSGGTRTLDTIPIGGTATLQVRVWNLASFPTYDAAYAAGQYGVSGLFDYTVPAAGSLPSAFYMEGLTTFNVVPEPSTIALGALGLAGLLFLRRRK